LCQSPWGTAWDTFCYDFFFLLRGSLTPTEDIVIVAIDEPSFGNLGLQWPWPRSIHAALINALYSAGAKVVVFDILFPEISLLDEDEALREAIYRHPSIVLAADVNRVDDTRFSQEIVVEPHPSLVEKQTLIGYTNLPLDPDGFIRNIHLSGSFREALSLVATRQFIGLDSQNILNTNGRINFSGPSRTFKTVSYYQALSPATDLPDGLFKNKLVFVGFNTQNVSDIRKEQPDHFPTPFTRWGDGYMAGVEIHANLAANLMQGNLIHIFPFTQTLLICLVALSMTGFFFFLRKPLIGGGVLILFWLVILFVSFMLFKWKHVYLPFLFVCLPMTGLYMVSPFFHYFESRRERNFIRQAFSTYVAPSVVRQLIANPKQLELGGEERHITAFFSDVEGFSGISEMLTPTELVTLLNEFLTEMTDIILKHQGTVDKFEGDAIIAMFGAPNQLPNHAEHACLANIEMQERLSLLRKNWQSRGLPALKMRIGMCTGSAVVGNMGSSRRMDYTMMGDTVNTASRLEGANKVYKTYCLISESTRKAAGKAIIARQIDTISVVGKKETVRIYEIIGIPGYLDDRVLQMIKFYEQGLLAYQHQEWQKAAVDFHQALTIMPTDGPSHTMINRCREFEKHPPDKDWKGVYKMKSK
jgi:adenylate cyclase